MTEPTPGELDRRLDRIDRNIEAGFAKIENKLTRMVTTKMFELAQANTQRQLDGLNDAQAAAERRWVESRDTLRDEIGQVEQQRADDRRASQRNFYTLLAAVLTAVAGLLAALLPLVI